MNKKQAIVLIVGVIILIILCILFIIDIDLFIGAAIAIIILLSITIGFFATTKRHLFESFVKEILPQRKKQENIENHVTKAEDKLEDFQQKPKSIEEQIITLNREINAAMNNIAEHIASQNKVMNYLQQQIENMNISIENIQLEMKQNKQADSFSNTTIDKKENSHYPMTYYAQMVDSLNPVGFYEKNLTRERDKSMFEIIVTNETNATYHLISDEALFDSMVSMFNPIITDSAEYDSIPSLISNITVIHDGILCLSNGIWQIIKKQKIHIE